MEVPNTFPMSIHFHLKSHILKVAPETFLMFIHFHPKSHISLVVIKTFPMSMCFHFESHMFPIFTKTWLMSMYLNQTQKSQNRWVNLFRPRILPFVASPTQLQHEQTKATNKKKTHITQHWKQNLLRNICYNKSHANNWTSKVAQISKSHFWWFKTWFTWNNTRIQAQRYGMFDNQQ